MSLEVRRLLLLLALGYVAFTLWQTWQREHPPLPTATTQIVSQQVVSETFQPSYPNQKSHASVSHAFSQDAVHQSHLIQVKTDVLNIKIDPKEGRIVSSQLLKYSKTKEQPNVPVTLFDYHDDSYYTAVSGMSDSTIQYQAPKRFYQLSSDQSTIEVPLKGRVNGVVVEKVLTFHRSSYEVGVSYTINNLSAKPWEGHFYYQLQRKEVKQETHGLFDFRPSTLSAAVSSFEKPFDKYSFKKLNKTAIDKNVRGGWVAMLQHYFVGAWIPVKQQLYHYYSHLSAEGLYTVGFIGPKVSVKAGQTLALSNQAKLYVGPELRSELKKAAPHLELTIDYGWLWIISSFLFKAMTFIYHWVGNWGWSIIILTLAIKVVFYHLSATSYRSMANMRRLQPQLTALKERYGDDRQRFTQAMMELYRKEGINPLSGLGGGCLPILIQIPVFIALYWVLLESVELRQAPFVLWIHDLSAKDPYYILPVVMGLTMLLQQRLSPAPPDPTQAKVMMILPVVFTFLFISFPAGLVLYWVVNNSVSILQQWHIMRKHDRKQKKKYRNKR